MTPVGDVQRRLPRQLGAWAAASVVTGVALEAVGRRRGDAAMTGFGRQCLLWGVVDGVVASYGVATRDRPLGRSRLEWILWANALADVGYLAGGLLWWRRGGDAARGAGAAVVVQAVYLLVSDVAHALVVHRDQDG